MPNPARERWDIRYKVEDNFSHYQGPRPYLVRCSEWLPASGLALDAASGLGNNAAYLLDCGLNVVGVDISSVGLRKARKRLPDLWAVQADLPRLEFPPATFDLIINFYFLERSLIPAYHRWLRPGGLLIFETLTTEMLNFKPELNPDFLLQPGELREAFNAWEILDYQEGWLSPQDGKQKAVASLAARRPVDM